jgi:hypothetical protein
MRLRRNEYCPVLRSLFCCGREAIRKENKPRLVRIGVQRVEDRITREDIVNFDRQPKCANY